MKQYLYKPMRDKEYPRAQDILTGRTWDKTCYIIGGGESLKGFDYSKLDGKFTIGINRSIEVYESTIWYGMDCQFLKMVQEGFIKAEKWENFKGIKIFARPNNGWIFDGNVYLVENSGKVSDNIDEGIDHGTNSGYGALMLAVALGCKSIFLLGYDMTVKESPNWHEGYPHQQNLEIQKKRVGKYIAGFDKAFSSLTRLEVSVYNCCPDSKLECFPKVGIDGAFSVAEKDLAPVPEESEFSDMYY